MYHGDAQPGRVLCIPFGGSPPGLIVCVDEAGVGFEDGVSWVAGQDVVMPTGQVTPLPGGHVAVIDTTTLPPGHDYRVLLFNDDEQGRLLGTFSVANRGA